MLQNRKSCSSSRTNVKLVLTVSVLIPFFSVIGFANRNDGFSLIASVLLGYNVFQGLNEVWVPSAPRPSETPTLGRPDALLFWRTDGASGTWTNTNWSNPASATGGTAWTSGSDVEFSANSTVTFASTAVGNLTVDDGKTVTVTQAGTLATGTHVFTIGTGSTLTWTNQAVSNNSASSFDKEGSGTWNIGAQPNNYTGGFTLGAGTVTVTGSKSFGTAALNINGGTISNSSGSTTTYGATSVVVGGDFIFAGSGTEIWNQPWDIGASSRTITNNTTGAATRTISNVISGASGSGLTFGGTGGSGGIVLSGANTFSGPLTVNGGFVSISNSNTYTGKTTVAGGNLTLLNAASIANSSAIELGGGSQFDIQAMNTALALSSGEALRATGTSSTATIFMSSTKGLTTAADSPVQFTAFNGSTPPLTVSNTNSVLALQSGNPVTVTISNGGTPLAIGSYKLIAKANSATGVTGLPTTLTVNGDGICAGCGRSLSIISGELFLNVQSLPTTPSITGSTPASPANNTSPTINGTADAGNTVKLYTTSNCTGGISGTGTATGGSFGIGVTVGNNSTTTFYATATDSFSNVSACSSGFSYTSDSISPSLSYTPLTNTTSTSAIPLAVTSSDSVAMGTVTIFYKINGGSFTSSGCTAGTPPAWTCTIPGQSSGTAVSYYVAATDAAGNTRNLPVNNSTFPYLYTVGAATVPAGGYTYLSLGDGTTLGGDVVASNLDLGGTVTTGANILELACGTVTGAGGSNYVVGNFKNNFCSAGTFVFPVGTTADGARPSGLGKPAFAAEYTPLTMTVNSGSFPAVLTVSVTDAILTGLDPSKSVTRSWNVALNSGSVNADMTFAYLDQDVNGTEANYKVFKNDGSSTTEVTPNSVNAGANTATVTGVSSFSGWGIGLLSPTAASVSISGRVVSADGRAVPGALVTVSGNGLGTPITVRSGPSGRYVIRDLEAGQTYIVSISSKRFRFRVPDRLVNLGDDVTGFDFIAIP